MHNHDDPYCNCEDCYYARDNHEVCSVCGSLVGDGCPCSEESETSNE